MASKKTHDLVANLGEYQVRGETKKRWQRCGSAFEDEEGRLSIKLDVVPMDPNWSGWFSLFPYERQSQQSSPAPASGGQPSGYGQLAPESAEDEDIPF